MNKIECDSAHGYFAHYMIERLAHTISVRVMIEEEDAMQIEKVVSDIGTELIGGYIGARIMEPVSVKLYEWEPEEARRQEDAVRPGTPYQIAAQKTTQMMGIELTNEQLEKVGLVFHYGLGMSWGLSIRSCAG